MPDPYAPHKSIVSIVAIVAAIGSFFVHSGVLRLLLAIVAIVLGLIGFLLALTTRDKGGVISVIATGFGAIGMIAGIIRAVWHFAGHL